jgi:ComF family protein
VPRLHHAAADVAAVGYDRATDDTMTTPMLDDTVHTPASRGSRLRTTMRRTLATMADIVVPPCCLVCRTPLNTHHVLCGTCWRDMRFITPPLCDVTGTPMPFDTGGRMVSAAALSDPPAYDRARAVAHFTGSMRTLVHHFKYADRHDARTLFGRWMAQAGHDLLPDAHVIVPVPMGRLRLFWRRFNQAAVLAREVSRHAGIVADPQLLVRARAASTQVGLTRDQRRRNVAGAFRVASSRLAALNGRNVLLIDDVITTGATVNACARALKRAGAARVDVLALGLVTDVALFAA